MAQIPVLFLPPRSVNGKKASIKKNVSKNINNKVGDIHERKEKKDKGPAYLFRAF